MKISQKKIDILETVESLINKEGFTNISIRKISKAAKINVAMISYYFGSKDKMIEELFKYRITKVTENLEKAYEELPEDTSPGDKIEIMVDHCVDNIFLFHPLYEVMSQNTKAKKSCINEIKKFHSLLVRIFHEMIKDGIEKKIFTPKGELEILVGSMLGTIFFFLRNSTYPGQFWSGEFTESNKVPFITNKIKTYLKLMISLMLGNKNEC